MTYFNLYFEKFWNAVKKRNLIIIFTTVFFLLISASYSLWKSFHPLYLSTSSIKFEKEVSVDDLFSRILASDGETFETQQIIITSHDLLAEAAENLSTTNSKEPPSGPRLTSLIEDLKAKISVERKKNSKLIDINVTDSDPVFAQKMAAELAEIYSRRHHEKLQRKIKEVIRYINNELEISKEKLDRAEHRLNMFSQKNQLISIDHQSENLLQRKKEIEDEIRLEADTGKIEKLENDLGKIDKKIDLLLEKKLEYNRLKRDVESLRSMVSFLEEKSKEAMIRQAESPAEVTVVKSSRLSSKPVNPPRFVITILAGLLAGVITGLILIILTEAFGDHTEIIEEIEKDLDMKIMGIIPLTDIREVVSGMKAGHSMEPDDPPSDRYLDLVAHFSPKTITGESFRAFRTNILYKGESKRIKTIAVTSSYPREGRSMVSANLAVSLAQTGLRTLLVGADFRSPGLCKIFSLEDTPGLTDILLGNCPWKDTVKNVTDMIMGGIPLNDLMRTPGLDNLSIITSGELPEKPAELLNSKKFTDFKEEAENEYDIIIFDSSPVLSSADAAILGTRVHGVLIVYRPGLVSRKLLKRASAQLKQVKCRLIGIVLNGVTPDIIPEALRNKYARKYSSGMNSVDYSIDQKKRKSILTPIIFLLIAAAALTVTGILWKKGMLFSERPSFPETEIERIPETSKNITPAQQKAEPPEAEQKTKKKEAESRTVTEEQTKKELPFAALEKRVEEIIEEQGRPEEGSAEYQEGQYPYSIYLGSFKTIERANRAVDLYAEKEISTYPVKVEFDEKGTWYRIYSGNYPEESGAREFIEENEIKDAEVKRTAYACYIDSYSENDELENHISFMEEKGFFPYIITDHVNNVHYLFAGAFITQSAAEDLSEELKAAGINSKVVAR